MAQLSMQQPKIAPILHRLNRRAVRCKTIVDPADVHCVCHSSASGTPRSRRNSAVAPSPQRVDDSAHWRSHAREIMGVVDGLEAEAEVWHCVP